jgi:hypothetical protein
MRLLLRSHLRKPGEQPGFDAEVPASAVEMRLDRIEYELRQIANDVALVLRYGNSARFDRCSRG